MTTAIVDPGHYFNATTKHDDVRDVVAHGTTILFFRPGNGQPETVQLSPEFTRQGRVAIKQFASSGTSVRVTSPDGNLVFSRPELTVRAPGGSAPEDTPEWYTQKFYGGVLDMVTGRAGVFAARFGGCDFSLLQGVAGELAECQLISRRDKASRGYFCPRTNGFLQSLPGCTARSMVTFLASGDVGSHVVLKGPEGVADFFLAPGEKRQILLGRPPAEPFALRIHGEPSSLTNIVFDSDVAQPFLYGASPSAIRKIASYADAFVNRAASAAAT